MEHRTSLGTVAREWGRIGCIGFGGPPAHIALLRQLCVERRQWLDAQEFEDAIAACNLLPGPASTELAIFCAWRVRGRAGALAGGLAFILPGLACILALSALFLTGTPPLWVKGAGAGAGAAVAAVAVQAGWTLLGPSWTRAGKADRARRFRWTAFLLAGGAAAATIGPWLVLVLLGCGVTELAAARTRDGTTNPAGEAGTAAGVAGAVDGEAGKATGKARGIAALPALPGLLAGASRVAGAAAGGAGLAGVAWVAFKVGALSFGGGFVIIPLMQADAVGRGWMTERPVPERGGAGPDHARAGGADGLRRRLRGRGLGRRPARRAGRVLPLVRRSCWVAPGTSACCAPAGPRRRSWTARAGRDRGDPGLGHLAGRGAARAVAVRGAGRGGCDASGATPRGGVHPARRGRGRAIWPGRRPAATLTGPGGFFLVAGVARTHDRFRNRYPKDPSRAADLPGKALSNADLLGVMTYLLAKYPDTFPGMLDDALSSVSPKNNG